MAADQLAAVSATAGIFGDFSAARQFRGAFTAAHDDHQTRLQGHHAALTAYSSKAATNARVLAMTDQHNAAAIAATSPQIL